MSDMKIPTKRQMVSLNLGVVGLVILLLLIAGCSQEKSTSTLPETHPEAWMDASSQDFHGNVALTRGATSCAVCHGADLNGGEVGISCNECHAEKGGCNACHGGVDNRTGAPPRGLHGEIDDTTLAVGAHTAHLEAGPLSGAVPCTTCHLVPLDVSDSTHLDLGSATLDSIAEITWGGLENTGEAAWDRTSRTCSKTYCHGNFDGGDTLNGPNWTGANQAVCGTCHDVGNNPASLLWKHEVHVGILGLTCYECHSGTVDSDLEIIGPSLHINGQIDTLIADQAVCDACHGPAGNPCVICHGGTDNESGAPPVGLRGETETTSPAVGAHTSHLADSPLAAGIACNTCHLVPADVIDTAHLDLNQPVRDSIAEITWGGLGNNGKTIWNRDSLICSGSYCHGNFLGGNDAAPHWTGSDQAFCGSCHDVAGDSTTINLLSIHKFHVGTAAIKCISCHATVVDADLNIISNTLHVNGNVETFTPDPALCDACHGFVTSCVVCHGGQDNNSGAPPVGLDGETATTELAVGAHTRHLSGGDISDGVPCSECHIRPSNPLDPGHLDSDGIPDMNFGPLAGASSIWDRNNAVCSGTYCHGNFSGGYASNSPVWTQGASQAVCGSCHAATGDYASLSGQHWRHLVEENIQCYQCHSTTVDAGLAIIGLDIHVDGTKDVSFSSGQGSYTNGQCTNTGCHSTESWLDGNNAPGRGPRP